MTLSAVRDRARTSRPFSHEALFYGTPEQFLTGTLSFIREAIAADEPILVVLSAPKVAAIEAQLGGHAPRVQFADMATVGANPARIIPVWRRFVDECRARGGAFRGIGEPIWPDRGDEELVECQRHEALLNLAFADVDNFRLLCPYDTSSLGNDVLREALRSHPDVVEGSERRQSELYLDLTDVAAPFDRPLPEPAHVLDEITVTAGSLAAIRQAVARRARASGMRESRIDDLVVAVNEITSNTVLHGGGQGELRLWVESGALVCEVADSGRITDPMAGRVEPADGSEGGRGLWMATQLCDLIQVRTFPTGGVVRLHVRHNA